MQNQHEITVNSIEQSRNQLMKHLRNLLDGSLSNSTWADGLIDTLAMLATLPLSTDEYGLATRRVHNARRYLTANERGAACFELQLLLGSIRNGDDARPIRRKLATQNAKRDG